MKRKTHRNLLTARCLENRWLVLLMGLGWVLGMTAAASAQIDGGDPRTTLSCAESSTMKLPSTGKVVVPRWVGPKPDPPSEIFHKRGCVCVQIAV